MKKKGLHGLLMMACCIVPMIAVLAFLPQIRSTASGLNWTWLFILLCPLMHIFMMKGMMGEKSCHGEESESKQVKDKAGLGDEQAR
ncbi:MAG: DUF2933 domain-containing protein [Peptococcaceae bacterium]|nr:DUF2933 domain-containing protein [Peptococcaceae bacterium]